MHGGRWALAVYLRAAGQAAAPWAAGHVIAGAAAAGAHLSHPGPTAPQKPPCCGLPLGRTRLPGRPRPCQCRAAGRLRRTHRAQREEAGRELWAITLKVWITIPFTAVMKAQVHSVTACSSKSTCIAAPYPPPATHSTARPPLLRPPPTCDGIEPLPREPIPSGCHRGCASYRIVADGVPAKPRLHIAMLIKACS